MTESLEQLIQQRRNKLRKSREKGQAFPNQFVPACSTAELRSNYAQKTTEALRQESVTTSIAGRIMQRRIMGKTSFITIQDGRGRLQVYVRQDGISNYEDFLSWDLGDIVGVSGTLFRTKTDELSIAAQEISMLVKAVRPLPDKHKGLQDREVRYRKRYLDLITNGASVKVFRQRARIIQLTREFLTGRGFLEVETPMLQQLPGGALAKPFRTFYNALKQDMYLRIAPELFLKQLLVGGLERVFEINRNFRNEGLSTLHNPEFTMLEFYEAYSDYEAMMTHTEELIATLITNIQPERAEILYQGRPINMTVPFARMTHKEAILNRNPQLKEETLANKEELRAYLKQKGGEPEKNWGIGKLRNEIFEKTVESTLIKPTFVTHYPAEVSPLARRNDENPLIADRFELIIAGAEFANGFSELNDYDEQARVFAAQKASKNEEAMVYDKDYLTALEYGMPPAGGAGIGIDRLVMLLTNQASIRDVLLFPQLREQGS